MFKTDRTFAAVTGEDADRVPVSAWWHDFPREWSAQGLAQATLEAYRKYDWDFIKVNPRATYYGEAWGARFEPSGRPDAQPQLIDPGVKSPEDLARVQPLDVNQDPFAEQLTALRIIRDELAGGAPFVQTVFSPLASMSRVTGSTKFVQRLMAEHPEELLSALDAIAATLSDYSRACLDAGAAGIFFATVEWGSADNISAADYDRFARPFDLRVLRAVESAPFNIFHVCRDNNHLARLLDYPAAVFHWDSLSQTNPGLAEIAQETDRAVMGGVDHVSTIADGLPSDVIAQAREAIAQSGGRRFLLAPACSISPQVPLANLRALAQTPRS
jgi:uroporphyrinogen decarboxylase